MPGVHRAKVMQLVWTSPGNQKREYNFLGMTVKGNCWGRPHHTSPCSVRINIWISRESLWTQSVVGCVQMRWRLNSMATTCQNFWGRLYSVTVLCTAESPMCNRFDKTKHVDTPPPLPHKCFVDTLGSRMTSHDWFYCPFLEFVAQRTSIDPHHYINPWRVLPLIFIWKSGPSRFQAHSCIPPLSLNEVWRMAAERVSCQTGRSVRSFIYISLSTSHLSTFCLASPYARPLISPSTVVHLPSEHCVRRGGEGGCPVYRTKRQINPLSGIIGQKMDVAKIVLESHSRDFIDVWDWLYIVYRDRRFQTRKEKDGF